MYINIPKTMRAVEIETPGGPEVLRLCERATPEPNDHEVLIRVAAAGVNRPDIFQRMGAYPPPPGASDLPGLEVAGTIAALGDKVASWKIGDEVCAILPGGGYAEFAAADEGSCLAIPKGVSLIEAAGLPETYFTVWANVFDDAGLKAGETLLVHGGTSGIGVTAIGLARALGSKVYATASTPEKCEQILALGADAAYIYGSDSWQTEISERGGADVVLDMAGGDFVARNIFALNPGGRHVSIAFLRGAKAEFNVMEIMRKRLRLSGSTMKARSLAEKARLANAISGKVWPLFAAGRLRSALDSEFALKDASNAHERIEKGLHTGKIVLKIAPE